MADEAKSTGPENHESSEQRRDWADEAEDALENVGIALREAWEASRGARLGALESAKRAALQLGEAIDQGVAAAREKWEAQEEGSASKDAATSDSHDASFHRRAPQMKPDEGRGE